MAVRVRKSVIAKAKRTKEVKKAAEEAAAPKTYSQMSTREIIDAIKSEMPKQKTPKPVVLEPKMPEEVVEQQKEIMNKLEAKKPPTYHFEVNRDSQGYIKNVVATPQEEKQEDKKDIAKTWYN